MKTVAVEAIGANSPVILFFTDDKGKAHASLFPAPEAAVAERAAGLMGARLLRVTSDAERALAAALPLGRVFESGKAFAPFAKKDVFAKLAAAAPGAFTPTSPINDAVKASNKPKGARLAVGATQQAGEGENGPEGFGLPPDDWAGLKVGSLALAAEEGKPTIWYIATIVSQRDEDLFELRWLEDGDGEWPLIVRRREHLALFPAGLAGALA